MHNKWMHQQKASLTPLVFSLCVAPVLHTSSVFCVVPPVGQVNLCSACNHQLQLPRIKHGHQPHIHHLRDAHTLSSSTDSGSLHWEMVGRRIYITFFVVHLNCLVNQWTNTDIRNELNEKVFWRGLTFVDIWLPTVILLFSLNTWHRSHNNGQKESAPSLIYCTTMLPFVGSLDETDVGCLSCSSGCDLTGRVKIYQTKVCVVIKSHANHSSQTEVVSNTNPTS